MEYILLKVFKDFVELWLFFEWFVVYVNRLVNIEKVKKSI